MKTLKLVTGILSIILFVFVTFQSCAAGLGNALADNGEVSGSAGLMTAICLLAAGIVSIATRNKETNGGEYSLYHLISYWRIIGIDNGWQLCGFENLGRLCGYLRNHPYYIDDRP